MGTSRWFKEYVEQVPIPPASAADKSRLSHLAEQCAAAAKRGDEDSLAAHEAEIDRIVYRLFDLTEDEIALIEQSLAPTRSGSSAGRTKKKVVRLSQPPDEEENAVETTAPHSPRSRRGRTAENPGGEPPCAAALFADELFGLPGDLPVATPPSENQVGQPTPGDSRRQRSRRAHLSAGGGGAEPRTAKSIEQGPAGASPHPLISLEDKDALIAVIRDAMDTGPAREREQVIRDAAQTAGFQRLGKNVSAAFDNAVRTAHKRGVLNKQDGDLYFLVRQPHTEWPRDFLKEQFLGSIGRTWIEREEAVRAFRTWFGFRRTGSLLDETARSLIHGLLVECRLEKDGRDWIRRV